MCTFNLSGVAKPDAAVTSLSMSFQELSLTIAIPLRWSAMLKDFFARLAQLQVMMMALLIHNYVPNYVLGPYAGSQ
jgi:hypothetical protein